MNYTKRTKNEFAQNYVLNLLLDRGIIQNADDIQSYYNPTRDNLIDPEKLDNIDEAFQIVLNHVQKGSKIHIIIDSDVDGFTSASIMYNYLNNDVRRKYPNFELSYKVPQEKEHGLRSIVDNYLDNKRYDLIIIPDGATNDAAECKKLVDIGYEIVIIDHHLQSCENPWASIVNNQISNNYEDKALSGAGMVYKFISYFDSKINIHAADKYLDLVALGEIADVMNLNTLENRYLITQGLNNINNALFDAMLKAQSYSLKGDVTQMGVAFYIGPLLNALIRMGNQYEKEQLFKALIDGEAIVPSTKRNELSCDVETLAEQCVRICKSARVRQNKEKMNAIEILNIDIKNKCLDSHSILILDATDFDISANLTGLIAASIAEQYKKPVLLGKVGPDNCLKGSIRNPAGSPIPDLRAFLIESGFMNFVEGHANAAGFSIKVKNVEKLLDYAEQKLKDINFDKDNYEVDFVLKATSPAISSIISEIDQHKDIWGQENPEPVLAIEHISLWKQDLQIIGKNKDTLKFSYNNIVYIKFKAQKLINDLCALDCGKIDITCIGRGAINRWNGTCSSQILIDAIEFSPDEKFFW